MKRLLVILLPPLLALAQIPAGGVGAETPVERGKYLVEVLGACGNCHTPKGTPKGPQGDLPDQHLATGIGALSEGQIIAGIYGAKRDGRALLPPMPSPYYAGKIGKGDLQAIIAYLRSLPPIPNRVPEPEPPKKP